MWELLSRHGFHLRKSMGQNFLIDPNIPEKIARLSGIDGTCAVLEVGPGFGALTAALARVAKSVTALELDSRLLPILHETVGSLPNVEIVQGDILKQDFSKIAEEKMKGTSFHVCANLPYNITTPALTAIIDSGVFHTITVMVQREVARRICAQPGSSDYGAFTVYANYHTVPETLFDVPPSCFVPQPKVFSSVIFMKSRLKRLLAPEEEAMFFRVVKAAFAQRRKMLVNALFAAFSATHSKPDITQAVCKCGFDVTIRGEMLGTDDFITLSSMMAH